MSGMKIKQNAKSYSAMMAIIDDYILNNSSDNESLSKISDISRNIAESSVLDNDDFVQYKLTSDEIAVIIDILTGCPDCDIQSDSHLSRLAEARCERNAELKEKAEYKEWLYECIRKYLTEDKNYTAKKIAELINDNDLKQDMKPVSYQSIYKHVNAVKNSIS